MRRWYVVTPAYDVVVPVLDYGQGPIEHEADVIEIEAETRRDASVLVFVKCSGLAGIGCQVNDATAQVPTQE